jgi:hypothetical protein
LDGTNIFDPSYVLKCNVTRFDFDELFMI